MLSLIPHHVAIVMDGNGRWALKKGLPRIEGHRAGAEALHAIVQHALLRNIRVLSLFAFSSENWSRPKEEVSFLMRLFLDVLVREFPVLSENKIALRFCGDRTVLDLGLQAKMAEVEALGIASPKMILNIAINYGGKWDILSAAKKLVHQSQQDVLDLAKITEDDFQQLLNTSDLPDPDLFIRTSGEQRISNFFLWQLAYTELYFTPILWPDFTPQALDLALEEYAKRERRYGQAKNTVHGDSHV